MSQHKQIFVGQCPMTDSYLQPCGAIVSENTPVSYWSIFSVSLVTVPEVFTKVNSSQFLSRI